MLLWHPCPFLPSNDIHYLLLILYNIFTLFRKPLLLFHFGSVRFWMVRLASLHGVSRSDLSSPLFFGRVDECPRLCLQSLFFICSKVFDFIYFNYGIFLITSHFYAAWSPWMNRPYRGFSFFNLCGNCLYWFIHSLSALLSFTVRSIFPHFNLVNSFYFL